MGTVFQRRDELHCIRLYWTHLLLEACYQRELCRDDKRKIDRKNMKSRRRTLGVVEQKETLGKTM